MDGVFLTPDEMRLMAGHIRECPACGRYGFALYRHDACGRFVPHEDATEYRCVICYKRVPRSAIDDLVIGHAFRRFNEAVKEDYASLCVRVYLGLAEFPEHDSD